MARSEGLELICRVPCVKFGVIAANCVPRPIWRGLVPQEFPVSAEPRLSVCKNCVANEACDALKPIVFELATLLPATSIVVSAPCRPVMAVLNTEERPMICLPTGKVVRFSYLGESWWLWRAERGFRIG